MDIISQIFLLLVGLAGGIISGLLGVGGGIFFILIIPYILTHAGLPSSLIVPFIVANSLFAAFFSSLVNVFFLIKNKFFFLKEVLLTFTGAGVASLISFYFILPQPWYSKTVFNIVIIIIILQMIRQIIFSKQPHSESDSNMDKNSSVLSFTGIGLGGGFISTLSGVGGGVIVVPFLNLLLKIPVKKSASISTGNIVFISLMITLLNLFPFKKVVLPSHFSLHHTGYIVWEVGILLAVGACTGAIVGSYLFRKISSPWIKKLFGFFLMVVLIKKVTELFL